MIRILSVFILILLTFIQLSPAEYVGAKKCKLCHNSSKHGKAYDKLYRTKHSKAYEGLVAEGKEDDPYCIECHTTGFGNGGFKIGKSETYNLKGVQCEECHGAGSEYIYNSIMKNKKKAISKGLIIPNKRLCMKCHDRKKYPWAKKFVYKERLKKIDHRFN